MNNFENKKIEQLEKEQLIRSILNRKQYEQEAIVEAAKEASKEKVQKNSSDVGKITKRKEEILQSKLMQERLKNEEEIKQKRKLIKESEEEYKKWQDQENELQKQRAKTVDKIMKELFQRSEINDPERNRRRLVQKENEILRKKQEEKRNKLIKFNRQSIQQKVNELKEAIKRNSGAISQEETPVKRNIPTKNIAQEQEDISTPSKMADIFKTTISRFKMMQGIKTYKNNMKNYVDYYKNRKQTSTFNITIGDDIKIEKTAKQNNQEDEKLSWQDTLKGVQINHEKALKDAESRRSANYRTEIIK